MKKLFFSALTLIALSIGASAQSVAKATPKKTIAVTHTTSKSNPAGTTTVEKTTIPKSTAAAKPRHKKHFVHKKKTATAAK